MAQVIVDDKELKRLLANIRPGEVVRILHDGVNYGIYNEFGTSRMNAHPFMSPAIEHVRPAYERIVRDIKELERLEVAMDKIARDAESRAKDLAPVLTGQLKSSIKVSTPEQF